MAIYKQFKTFSSSICLVIMAVIKVALVGIIHNLAGICEVTQQSLSSIKQICMKLISLGKGVLGYLKPKVLKFEFQKAKHNTEIELLIDMNSS